MNKLLFILFASITILSFNACDYIGNPTPPSNANISDTSSCTSPVFPIITSHVKKILIEDYTGHTCTNCPRAAQKLHDAVVAYPGKVIGLGIHVGTTFASPVPPGTPPSGAPAGSYTNDFRTPIGDIYDGFFRMTAGGLPKLMVNRTPYNATTFSHRIEWFQVADAVAAVVNESPTVELQIINDFNPASKKLCTHIKTEFLTANTGTFKLAVLLVQDSITGWQFDAGVNKPTYVHRHVLRDAINSAWGDTIAIGTIPAATISTTKFAYNIPNDFKNIPTDMHHMYVVAFVYDATTYEVLQAEEQKIMP